MIIEAKGCSHASLDSFKPILDLINWREVNAAVIKLVAGHFKPHSEAEAVAKYIVKRQTEQSVDLPDPEKPQISGNKALQHVGQKGESRH